MVGVKVLDNASYFCEKHDIDIPNTDDTFLTRGRPQRKAHEIINLHNYQVDLFYAIIDIQLQELNSHFTEVNIELILCVDCLNPSESYVAFGSKS